MRKMLSARKIIFYAFLILFIKVDKGFCFDLNNIAMHGFLSQGYLKTDENNYMAHTEDGTFQFNEFGLNFTSTLTDDLRVGIQLFGRDLGHSGNDEVTVDWAYGDYRWKDWLGVRFGKMKLDYGLYNEIREIDFLRTSIFLPNAVYNESWREELTSIKGLGIYGEIPTTGLGNFIYSFQIGALTLDPDSASANVLEQYIQRFGITTDINNYNSNYSYTYGACWETPLEGLRLKLSGEETQGLEMTGPAKGVLPADLNRNGIIEPGEGIPVNNFSYETDISRFMVASAEYQQGNLLLAAEYIDADNKIVLDFGNGIRNRKSAPWTGWYVSGSYRINSLLALGLSYSEFKQDTNDKHGKLKEAQGRNYFESWMNTWSAFARFDISRNWVLKLETSYNDGWTTHNPQDNPPEDVGQYWWLFAAKATVSF